LKVALVSLYSDIYSPGVRSISAYLRANGVETRLIFIPNLYVKRVVEEFLSPYRPEVLEGVVGLCRDVDLVGISLMTNLFERAVQLTEQIRKRLDVLVVWGGVHPTVRPVECLEYADCVVVGEGEEAMLELAQNINDGLPFEEVRNVWLRTGNGIKENPIRPLVSNLDTLPAPDFENPEYFVFDPQAGGFVVPDEKLLKRLHGKGPLHRQGHLNYQTIATRGCPYDCSFCGNSALVKLYGKRNYVRRRSVGHIIDELVAVKNRYRFINRICFFDDSFFAASVSQIREFAEAYKRNVGLPLFCLGGPRTITREKLEALVDAGLSGIQMGIQTGSRRINTMVYNRDVTNLEVLRATELINSFSEKIPLPLYDIIVDNPYETVWDGIETVKLLMQIKRPFTIQTFSLTFFPGTALYDRAKRDGLIKDEKRQVYRKFYMQREGRYINLLIALVNRGTPRPLMRLLTSRWVVRFFSSQWLSPLYRLLYLLNEKLSLARDRIAPRPF